MLGDVVVKGVEDAEDLVVDFVLKMSEESLKDRINIEPRDGGIEFKVRVFLAAVGSSSPVLTCSSYLPQTDLTPYDDQYSCIEVLATVSVPLSKPEYVNFLVRSESMNIILDPSLDLKVEGLSLSAISGDVTVKKAYGIDSQSTIIVVDNGDITGDFGLFDLVHLETKA